MQRRAGIAVCFFGEGAAAEGEFHESMNLAALWRLPVLFVCENNLYAMGTALSISQSVTDVARKADGYGMASAVVDGMDVLAVSEAAAAAVAHVRAGAPYLLECRTYRFRPHSMFDAELYRTKEEVAEWKTRDPIAQLLARGTEAGLLTEADVAAVETEVAREIDEAVAFADARTWGPVEDLRRFVHSEEARS